MGMRDWIVRLRSHDEGRILESANFANPDAAMGAYRALLGRQELVGEKFAAVFKPPVGAVTEGNSSTWFSRFDRDVGDGRVSPLDPRLDPWATPERVHEVQTSLPPDFEHRQLLDWERDGRAFGDVLKAWHGNRGLTRDEAAAELRVPRSTYDGWCAGRASSVERTVRRLITLLDAEAVRSG